jgi:hypothetical protein
LWAGPFTISSAVFFKRAQRDCRVATTPSWSPEQKVADHRLDPAP